MRKKDRNKIVEPDYTIYEVKPDKGDERKLSAKRMERRGLVSENKKKDRVFFAPILLGVLFALGAIAGLIYVFATANWHDTGTIIVFVFSMVVLISSILSLKIFDKWI